MLFIRGDRASPPFGSLYLEGRWDSPLGADQHYLSEDSHNCFEALVRDNQAENVRVRDISAVGNA